VAAGWQVTVGMSSRRKRWVWRAPLLLCALLLTACKVDLFTGLEEREGNEILAVLLTNNIPATKLLGKDNVVTISVDESDVAAAIDLLNRQGYPRDKFDNLGTIFQKQGLISSPLEERIRYIYALSQTISETISLIDGVLTARVHIVLPQAELLDEVAKPSSASVFIKYRPGYGLEEQVPKIKLIVQNSVEGLSYDKISVALFRVAEVPVPRASGTKLKEILGLRFTDDSLIAVAVLGGLLLGALGGCGYLVWRGRRRSKPRPG
jgi:type III secretion protein J